MNDLLNQAISHFDQADYENAEMLLTKVLHSYPFGHDCHNKALHYQGYVKCELSKYNEAKIGFSQLLSLSDSLYDKAMYNHQLAKVERLSGDYLQAYYYIEEEEKIRSLLPNDDKCYTAIYYEYSQLALLHDEVNDAKVFIEQSLSHALNTKDDGAKACAYRGLGDVHEAMNDKLKAIENYSLSKIHFKFANDHNGYNDVHVKSNKLIKRLKIIDK